MNLQLMSGLGHDQQHKETIIMLKTFVYASKYYIKYNK